MLFSGQDQIVLIADLITEINGNKKSRIGIESVMSNYLPEGNIAHMACR